MRRASTRPDVTIRWRLFSPPGSGSRPLLNRMPTTTAGIIATSRFCGRTAADRAISPAARGKREGWRMLRSNSARPKAASASDGTSLNAVPPKNQTFGEKTIRSAAERATPKRARASRKRKKSAGNSTMAANRSSICRARNSSRPMRCSIFPAPTKSGNPGGCGWCRVTSKSRTPSERSISSQSHGVRARARNRENAAAVAAVQTIARSPRARTSGASLSVSRKPAAASVNGVMAAMVSPPPRRAPRASVRGRGRRLPDAGGED